MKELSFNFYRTSADPGWKPSVFQPHHQFWQQAATSYTYVVGSSGIQYSSKDQTDPATGFSYNTFSSLISNIVFSSVEFKNTLKSPDPLASLKWTEDGDTATLALTAAWNTIKNVEIANFDGKKLVLENWVNAWVHLNNSFSQEIRIDGSKRGEVVTGSGNDTI
jgi:hypothetical protein